MQVGADGSVGQEELFADLFVGQAGGGQLGDLPLLRGQGRRVGVRSGGGGDPCGAEFVAGPLCPCFGAELVESVDGGAQV